jgi:hypothetical protein
MACSCSTSKAASGGKQLEVGRLNPLVNTHVAEQWKFQLPEYVLQQSFIGQVGAPFMPSFSSLSTIGEERRNNREG